MGVSRALDAEIWEGINSVAKGIEERLDGQVIYYYGPIYDVYLKDFRNFIEKVASHKDCERLIFFLHTGGGQVQACEKIVEIIRYHYSEVYFIVPDLAMSAGTILCMSGEKIFMDYSSSLGPIDPQVLIDDGGRQQFVPALGHLDMVERLIQKSRDNSISPAEFTMLQNQNLAILRSYEQARDLSVELLKKWLVNYKFKSWVKHKGTVDERRKDELVTDDEKRERADQIANLLGNNNVWHSHGRMIGVKTLKEVLHLEISDYSKNHELRILIRRYADLLSEHLGRSQLIFYLHHHEYHIH